LKQLGLLFQVTAIFLEERPVEKTVWIVRGQLVSGSELLFCLFRTMKIGEQARSVHTRRYQLWRKRQRGRGFLQRFLEVTSVGQRNSQVYMGTCHFRLAIGNASKQGDGISMFAESTLDFAEQSQHSVVLGGKLRGLLQRNFRLRQSALRREILSCFHQLVDLRGGRPVVSWA
jgi:hypothetical protein